MKKILYLFLSGAILLFSSCDKSSQTPDNTTNYENDITSMVNLSSEKMENQEVITDDASGDIFMMNDGIVPDFLVDESYIEDPANQDPSRLYIRDNSFIKCLRGLSLDETQIVQVKRNLHSYYDCKERAVNRAKEIYQELREKYKAKYQRLLSAVQNGTISREEFRTRVAQLKEDFRAELRRMHLKEKLNDALRECLQNFLRNLHGSLSERQWNAFCECYRQ